MTRIKHKEAIGIKVGRGRPSTGIKPGKEELLNLYTQESRSIREMAEILECKKDVVHYWLKKYGIKTRTMAKRSKLLKYSLSGCKRGLRQREAGGMQGNWE